MNPEDRKLPENLDAERGVLGAILILAKGALAVLDYLVPENFHAEAHRLIFRAMLALSERVAPIDPVSVTDELHRAQKLELIPGGADYVGQLGDGIPHISHVMSYARIVKEKARLRDIIFAANKIMLDADEAPSAALLLDESIERFSNISRTLEETEGETVSFRDGAVKLLSELEEGAGIRIFTGVNEFDQITGGFRPGELIVFTAETGTGKTLFAQQTRARACSDGYHGLYASGEMLAQHLVSREAAADASVEQYKMRRADCLTRDDWKALTQALWRTCTKCQILDRELTLARIRRAARQMARRGDLRLLVLDYDELIEAPGKDEIEQQKNLVRGAKSMAMELRVPVILIGQMRKALQGEDRKRPTLQRLYGTGAKSKHSSIVVYIDRPFVQELRGDETAARLIILKNRDGRLGALDVSFNISTLRFQDAAATVES
jgi:replicative DNA helicase